MDRYYSIGQVSEMLGVSIITLRRWDKSGKLVPDIRTQGGHRRYSETTLRKFLGQPLPSSPGDKNKKVILYARVSSRAHKDDLENQVQTLKQFCIGAGQSYDDVWTDIGSGLNYRRSKFRQLITKALNGRLEKVIVAHKDRLARFGYDLIEAIFAQYGTKLVVINRSEKPDPEFMHELTEDLIAIVQHFCAKFYGRRSYKCRQVTELARQMVCILEGEQ
ncbi:MAG: IS607 family transposase [Candidatus Bipolaricaulia bacterium]